MFNNFNVIINNSSTGYGTASWVRNCLQVEDISFDTEGRIIVFNINGITFCNIYLKAGTDSASRASRENYCSSVLPNLLVNRSTTGVAGGDWNSIICKQDATNHPESKLSPGLKRLAKLYEWKDSHYSINPSATDFSHYYEVGQTSCATRIDRQYMWGDVSAINSKYIPVAFSDHLGYCTEMKITKHLGLDTLHRNIKNLKINNNVASDNLFKERVAAALENWKDIRKHGLDVLTR